MLPIVLLSTTIFLSLSLLRTHLSHERSLSEADAQIADLTAELERLRRVAGRRIERERKERERLLPIVVQRVLERVGAYGTEEEPEEETSAGSGLVAKGVKVERGVKSEKLTA